MKKAGGMISQGRINGAINLTRALGDLEYKDQENISAREQLIISVPEVKTVQRSQVDFIIMGCDGIW